MTTTTGKPSIAGKRRAPAARKAPRFEYHVLASIPWDHSGLRVVDIETKTTRAQALNELGAQGWRLLTTVLDGGDLMIDTLGRPLA